MQNSISKIYKGIKKNGRNYISKIADVGGVLSLLILLFSLLPISRKIDNIEQQLNTQTANNILLDFFSRIESNDLTGAYMLFSDEKKKNNPIEGYMNWLKDLVAFEGLKITPIPSKDTAIQKVFLVEYGFKKRGMKTVDTKQGFYLRYNKGKREINYSTSPIYENSRKEGACEFYQFEHCNIK